MDKGQQGGRKEKELRKRSCQIQHSTKLKQREVEFTARCILCAHSVIRSDAKSGEEVDQGLSFV